MQWIRSLLFIVQMYVVMAIMGIAFLPLAIASRSGARFACRVYCRWVRWTARWMVGLRTEVRGVVPTGETLIVAKHQSFLDIIMIYGEVPAGKFIMKRELMWTPLFGQYALRIGCVPVDRGRKSAAILKMVKDVEAGAADPGQLIIYAQGTRVAPGVKLPYKVGSSVLYETMGKPCVPAATNVGLFWPRRGLLRKPGLAVVEFLDPVQPGQDRATFLAMLERDVEAASDRLMAEAGFVPPQEARPA